LGGNNAMEQQGGISWEPQGKDLVLVEFWKVVLPSEVDALVRALHAAGQNSPAKLPPVLFKTNNRSFGRLPPGSHPRWQSREWIGFALWLLVVRALRIGAAWRNASYFF